MARAKKSRKVGQIGARKDPNFSKENDSKKRNAKGNPSGSRNSVTTEKKNSQKRKQNTDPRHGSKKPIALIKPEQKVKYKTPQAELNAIEADARLTALLDKVENGESLRIEQQLYVDEKLARHAILCDLLGIEPESEESDDPYASLDAISLSDFDDSDTK